MNIAVRIAAVMCAIAAPASAMAQAQPVSAPRPWTTADPAGSRGALVFIGHTLGDPLSKAYPDAKTRTDAFGLPLCRTTPGLPGFLDCEDHSRRRPVDGIPRVTYEGVEVAYILLRYMNERLVGFTMAYEPRQFPALAAVMERQYGKPTHVEFENWKERLGLQYNTRIHSWNTAHGVMKLQEQGTAVGTGTLMLIEPAAERRYDALRYRQIVD